MFAVDHTYILCDPVREPNRVAYLQKWLDEHNIPKESYSLGLYCYSDTIDDSLCAELYDPWQNRHFKEMGCSINKYNIKKTELSLMLNWKMAADDAVKANYKTVMFFESDVLFFDNFIKNLQTAMDTVNKQDWDFLSISAGANLRPSRPVGETNQQWFTAPKFYHTRTADAMIFKVSMLEKILDTLFPVADVWDWELNYQLTLHNSKSFWLDPPILEQGSGRVYPTTL